MPKTQSTPQPPSKPPLTSPFPLLGKPWQRRFPTPRIEDSIVSVRKDTRIGFKMPEKGDLFDGVDQQDRLSKKFTFATAVPVEQSPGFVDLYYLAPFVEQEQYNFTVAYPFVDKDYPQFTRAYIVQRTDDLVTQEPDADDFDPEFGKPFQLTDHKIERFTDDPVMDANFVRVMRVFERLPGPVIKSFKHNQYQQVVTISTQDVATSVPPPQSALTEGSEQERTGTAKAKNVLASVPRVFPQAGSTREIPSMTRELWLGGFEETSDAQVFAGQVGIPALSAGKYAVTEKQLTEFKKEITIKALPLPQTRHHRELTELFGGGILDETISILDPATPADVDEGYFITESKLRNLEAFGRIKLTKELALADRNPGLKLVNGGTGFTSPPSVSFSPSGAAAHTLIGYGVASVAVTNPGSDYSFAPTVSFQGGGGYGAAGTVILSFGIQNLSLLSGGSNFSSVPTVSFVGGFGSGATATAALGFVVAHLTLGAQGSNYTRPTVTLVGGNGSGATATVTVVGKRITAITLTNAGAGYTSAPTVVITDPTGSGASATAVLATHGSVIALTMTAPGFGYTQLPTVVVSGGGGSGVSALAVFEIIGKVAAVVMTSAGQWYSSAPVVLFSSGQRNTLLGGGGIRAQGNATLAGTGSVSSLILDTPGNYEVAPVVSFSGGGGAGASATYDIGNWPVLYESHVDEKYGIVTQMEKKVVPARTIWMPGDGYTDIQGHDKWRSIQIATKVDLSTLPPPLSWPTTRHVSLPPTLLDIIGSWDASVGATEEENATPNDEYAQVTLFSSVDGSIEALVQHGYQGPALAIITRTFYFGPPVLANLPVPMIITPVSGTVSLFSYGITMARGTGDVKGMQHDKVELRTHSRTIGPVLTGNFLAGRSNTSYYQGLSVDGFADSGTYAVELSVGGPVGKMIVNLPLSNPHSIVSGQTYLDDVNMEEWRFGIFVVHTVQVFMP